jgi:hypothetical protein
MTEKKHAKLSASSSEMWLKCAGSIKAQEAYKNTSSSFALEGTFAHELADLCLKNTLPALSYLNDKLTIKDNNEVKTLIVTSEMASFVQEYLDYVKSYETHNSILYTENRVDFSNYVPEGFGTMDSAVYVPDTETLHIFDLKYGKGVKVEATGNSQGMLYALGMINELDGLDRFNDVFIHIVQPRIDNFSMFHTNKNDLLSWADYVKERAELALTNNAPRTAGYKQCLFCLAKNECETRKKHNEKNILSDFDDI